MPVVHCGSVRQAATVLRITELRGGSARGSGISDGMELGLCSLAPAVAAAAALLCSDPEGAEREHPVSVLGIARLRALSIE